ncbi:hypothetical protein RJ639_032525 [Escallonia herrerae]|uniref:Uncharacterized protein n=1 Tax=Escallonia herrerae TaxID=1293975 RepID=A0AA88WUR8_9ASTE|nr:hypothetical protein RJ639_032525 [Escallonia herrerae]
MKENWAWFPLFSRFSYSLYDPYMHSHVIALLSPSLSACGSFLIPLFSMSISPTTTHSISQAAEVIREAAPVSFVPLSCRRPSTEKTETPPPVQLHISLPSSGSVKALPLSSCRVPTISLTSSQRSVIGENEVLSPAQLSKGYYELLSL